jgi:hypothetical protein
LKDAENVRISLVVLSGVVVLGLKAWGVVWGIAQEINYRFLIMICCDLPRIGWVFAGWAILIVICYWFLEVGDFL